MSRRHNLRTMTTAEQLWAYRRLHGWTQDRAAAEFGMTSKTYWWIENGVIRRALPECINETHIAAPGVLCALARRRHGLTFRQTAAMLGISHVTLSLWEWTGERRLVDAWRSKGYDFGY